MSPTPGLLFVRMNPQNDLSPAEFHDWYNNEHGPTRLRLACCENGFRYRALDIARTPYSDYRTSDTSSVAKQVIIPLVSGSMIAGADSLCLLGLIL